MDKVDRVINTIRQLREEGSMVAGGGMTTQSNTGVAGFGSKAVDPVAGLDAFVGKKTRKNGTVDFRRIPQTYKKWVVSLNGKK